MGDCRDRGKEERQRKVEREVRVARLPVRLFTAGAWGVRAGREEEERRGEEEEMRARMREGSEPGPICTGEGENYTGRGRKGDGARRMYHDDAMRCDGDSDGGRGLRKGIRGAIPEGSPVCTLYTPCDDTVHQHTSSGDTAGERTAGGEYKRA